MRFLQTAALAALLMCAPLLARAQTEPEPAAPPAESAPAPAAAPAEAIQPDASSVSAPAQDAAAQEAAAAQAFYDSLNRRTGAISLANGKVALNVPETHYYLGPEDSRRVIVELWGNPPQAAEGVLGMIFLANANPYNSWGAVLEYLPDGHVDDSEARTINYDELLHSMQEQMRQANPERVRLGYSEMTLEGWAESPHYEQATHTLYWASCLPRPRDVR